MASEHTFLVADERAGSSCLGVEGRLSGRLLRDLTPNPGTGPFPSLAKCSGPF